MPRGSPTAWRRRRRGPARGAGNDTVTLARRGGRTGLRTPLLRGLRRWGTLRHNPRTAFNFQMSYGAFLFSKKKYHEAAAEYARAESAAPHAHARGRAATNQGAAFFREGALSEARPPLDRAIRVLKRSGHKVDLAV